MKNYFIVGIVLTGSLILNAVLFLFFSKLEKPYIAESNVAGSASAKNIQIQIVSGQYLYSIRTNEYQESLFTGYAYAPDVNVEISQRMANGNISVIKNLKSDDFIFISNTQTIILKNQETTKSDYYINFGSNKVKEFPKTQLKLSSI